MKLLLSDAIRNWVVVVTGFPAAVVPNPLTRTTWDPRVTASAIPGNRVAANASPAARSTATATSTSAAPAARPGDTAPSTRHATQPASTADRVLGRTDGVLPAASAANG